MNVSLLKLSQLAHVVLNKAIEIFILNYLFSTTVEKYLVYIRVKFQITLDGNFIFAFLL